MKLPSIVVNRHSVARMRDRHGLDMAALSYAEIVALIIADVQEAIREGRRGDRSPRWGSSSRRTTDGQSYAWTEDGERVYVIRSGKSGTLFVTTVLNGSDSF